MNQQWLTILKKKMGPTFYSIFKNPSTYVALEESLQRLIPALKSKDLKSVKAWAFQLYDVAEEVSPPLAKKYISALNQWVRPVGKNLNVKIVSLNPEFVKIHVEARQLQKLNSEFFPSFLSMMAVEAIRAYWNQHIEIAKIMIQVDKMELNQMNYCIEPIEMSLYINEQSKEQILFELRLNKVAKIENEFSFTNLHQQNSFLIKISYSLIDKSPHLLEN